MKVEGIVLDVRGNTGGNILAAEWMLQSLSKERVVPEPAQFINTPLVSEICQIHSPSATVEGLDLTPWYESIRKVRQTGSTYTLGFPITPATTMNQFRAQKKRKLVLIVDALCYSATDIFTAGFKDHRLGKVLGLHDNTGAGGANVWSHTLIRELISGSDGVSGDFHPLPSGAEFTVAVRRTLHVAADAGVPVEDLGTKPDILYRMTRADVLGTNSDLIDRACQIIAEE
jgi:C-terminal processing protease CtpA/Prc